MNTPEYYVRPTIPYKASKFQSAKRVSGVNADPDHVTGRDAVQFHSFERLVHDDRITIFRGRCRRQNVQPPGSNDSNPKRYIARIN
jgi:hypothetical protein